MMSARRSSLQSPVMPLKSPVTVLRNVSLLLLRSLQSRPIYTAQPSNIVNIFAITISSPQFQKTNNSLLISPHRLIFNFHHHGSSPPPSPFTSSPPLPLYRHSSTSPTSDDSVSIL
uniref:Uncharacterized protein n=1 Tax=Kalanchoe fedtschenkoi TaxID=63787 RepID=A0A7N0T3F9_KALFE